MQTAAAQAPRGATYLEETRTYGWETSSGKARINDWNGTPQLITQPWAKATNHDLVTPFRGSLGEGRKGGGAWLIRPCHPPKHF